MTMSQVLMSWYYFFLCHLIQFEARYYSKEGQREEKMQLAAVAFSKPSSLPKQVLKFFLFLA